MWRMTVGADHAGAKTAGDLSRGTTDAASGADQQNRLVAPEPCRFKATPGGHVVAPNRRGLVEAEVVGLPAQTSRWHGDHLRKGAVASEAGVAGSPDLRPDPLGRPRLNHAGEIAAGDTRQRRLLHGPSDVLAVPWIDRGGHHAHQRHRLGDGRSRYLR